MYFATLPNLHVAFCYEYRKVLIWMLLCLHTSCLLFYNFVYIYNISLFNYFPSGQWILLFIKLLILVKTLFMTSSYDSHFYNYWEMIEVLAPISAFPVSKFFSVHSIEYIFYLMKSFFFHKAKHSLYAPNLY